MSSKKEGFFCLVLWLIFAALINPPVLGGGMISCGGRLFDWVTSKYEELNPPRWNLNHELVRDIPEAVVLDLALEDDGIEIVRANFDRLLTIYRGQNIPLQVLTDYHNRLNALRNANDLGRVLDIIEQEEIRLINRVNGNNRVAPGSNEQLRRIVALLRIRCVRDTRARLAVPAVGGGEHGIAQSDEDLGRLRGGDIEYAILAHLDQLLNDWVSDEGLRRELAQIVRVELNGLLAGYHRANIPNALLNDYQPQSLESANSNFAELFRVIRNIETVFISVNRQQDNIGLGSNEQLRGIVAELRLMFIRRMEAEFGARGLQVKKCE